MNIANSIAAKIMGEILARGMSLSSVDIKSAVNSDAIDALCEIQAAVLGGKNESQKIEEIKEIMGRYMIL